jgi:hypothetical protein
MQAIVRQFEKLSINIVAYRGVGACVVGCGRVRGGKPADGAVT